MGVYVYKESTDELQKIAGLGLEEKDTQMSDTSTNAVQNKTIKSYVDNRIDNINVGIDTTNDEYEQWKILGQLKENTDYYIEDIGLDEYDAENMSFDNTRKQLGSSVQTAIEAVDDKCIALNANIENVSTQSILLEYGVLNMTRIGHNVSAVYESINNGTGTQSLEGILRDEFRPTITIIFRLTGDANSYININRAGNISINIGESWVGGSTMYFNV